MPTGAQELSVQCFDSRCGRIDAGPWVLDYDRGRLAGPGHLAEAPSGALEMSSCAEVIGGHHVEIRTFRFPPDSREHGDRAGMYCGQASTPLPAPGGGLYLSVVSSSADDLREFLAALRTLRIGSD